MRDPKIELHVHVEGTIRAATLLDLARRNGATLPADTVEGLVGLYEFTDFAHFIEVWILTTNCLRQRADFHQVVVDYAAEAAGFGAVYLEAIFSPAERVKRGVGWDDIFEGYLDGAQDAKERYGVEIRFTPDLYRGLEPELAEEVARRCVRYRDRGIVGLGLGGMEKGLPSQPYARAFDIARDGGLALVPHAGEADGPASVRDILRYDPARIRHGVRAAEDPDLLDEIRERGIVLDVCPTSNVRTGSVPDLAGHPLPRLRAAGIPCTVNTDDPAMFGTDLGREYEVAAALGVSAADAYAAGLAGALCDQATRERLAALAPATP
ncbi:MAG TPA: adenosine deaminase [Rugosimonospora sp.]|nr:adenosine deaminase [Rugosimonospora sp.]